ncbi:MAG: 50S ribosomal protein L25/general stress protein Ctc [Xanthomonadales bacterium]|jgi:large subunit ribosomal protein L25|uniref:50S ribosomal protein L25/general stress protein Ctc n=1 Tax=Dokdonella sp. TaxID=2291710 RepID=UPI002BBE413F|nr:50S ribosomal protein L25/general stress protein Ctc [Xanthomonadales bacterium]HQV73138.1 50S ribosomal protein L25/general stress protein Ctc [Dokdonella sp.]MBK7211596.1 50S ribosomal protein L25/general stress protein Ctc [Xanthomonadales bacterium]MBL0221241.1 50S ribosomal protein L25/general stress protein Ctc [Xanthomonadales bacterium]HQW75685.1 50S ribosomal protein L25/general stress protein Ctc [Dokdonella sp.]
MAKTHQLAVTLRKDEGKGASRRLRRTGSVPAVVYGGGKLDPVSIQIAHKDVYMASQNEWFYSAIIDLSLGGDVQKVLLRDMQRHPFKQQILHLDFLRINEDEAIRVRVPLHFINQESSPAGKTGGAIIMHEMTEVEISCLPKDLPEFIEVDLAELKVDDIIHLSGLKLPKGTEIVELKLGKEHDIAVVIAKLGRVEVEATEAAEGTAAAGEKKADGDK